MSEFDFLDRPSQPQQTQPVQPRPIPGGSVPAPQYAPPMPQPPQYPPGYYPPVPKPPRRFPWWGWLLIGLFALMSFGGIGGLVYALWGDGDGEDKPRDRDEQANITDNLGEHWMGTEQSGMSSLLDDLIDDLEDDKIQSMEEFLPIWKAGKDKVRKRKGENVVDLFKRFNGSNWDAGDLADELKEMKRGIDR